MLYKRNKFQFTDFLKRVGKEREFEQILINNLNDDFNFKDCYFCEVKFTLKALNLLYYLIFAISEILLLPLFF